MPKTLTLLELTATITAHEFTYLRRLGARFQLMPPTTFQWMFAETMRTKNP